jgi:hypothetical protein
LRQIQARPQFEHRFCLVHRVKVQPRCARHQQLIAQVGHHVQAECADRFAVVAVALQAQPDPARDLGAAGVGKACQLRVIGDRHDARDDRHGHTELLRLVDEAKVGVGVVEVLGDRRVRARRHLAREVAQVVVGRPRLRVHFRVRGDFDVEPVAGLLANELDQLVGVAKVTAARAGA